MTYYKVKDKDHLIRDVDTNAIINTDETGYHQYIENYKRAFSEAQRIKNLESEMSEIKSDLSEIKNLLRNLLK
jgi:Fe-S oxidoreductase